MGVPGCLIFLQYVNFVTSKYVAKYKIPITFSSKLSSGRKTQFLQFLTKKSLFFSTALSFCKFGLYRLRYNKSIFKLIYCKKFAFLCVPELALFAFSYKIRSIIYVAICNIRFVLPVAYTVKVQIVAGGYYLQNWRLGPSYNMFKPKATT